jgi:hypothetical protein
MLQERLSLISFHDGDLELTMPWILRFAIGSLFVFVIGAVMIAWACMSTGWETLSRFAVGCVTAGAGLIGTALLAMLSAVIYQGWRRFSLALMTASVLLFLALLIFAKFA